MSLLALSPTVTMGVSVCHPVSGIADSSAQEFSIFPEAIGHLKRPGMLVKKTGSWALPWPSESEFLGTSVPRDSYHQGSLGKIALPHLVCTTILEGRYYLPHLARRQNNLSKVPELGNERTEI